MSSGPAIELRNLVVHFGLVKALEIEALDVAANTITAIIGPNGAGKTTIFHAITGDLGKGVRQGCIRIDGQDASGWRPVTAARNGVGKLFQDVRVFSSLTVRQNLKLALLEDRDRSWRRALIGLRSESKRDLTVKIDDLLVKLDLSSCGDHRAGDLSFGQQKVLAVGRLMARNSSILLLDEPMAGLSRHQMQRMVARIREQVVGRKATVLLIEHNFEKVRELATHVVVLNEGRVFRHGPCSAVMNDAAVTALCSFYEPAANL